MAARTRKKKHSSAPAKISAPQLVESYRRARLFRILDRARRKRVIFVSAPAGAGKTSVVASYLAARRLPALWYNVDARDADIANLFEYLSMAARATRRGRGAPLPRFRPENQAGPGAFARTFFEALSLMRPVPSVIVLDDFHEAQSESWGQVIREALRALPKGIVAIIMSRAEPPPFFARHVAAGEMIVLGWNELRLTATEVVGLVRAHRPDWKSSQLKARLPRMLELANGWAAALMLLVHDQAALDRDASGIEEFSQRLFDYFATEIFSAATASERDFLLRTSVAPSLTAELAARLTHRSDAGSRLALLERQSFLIQQLGASKTYRYHPLLRGFLRQRAETELGSDEVRELHRRAAESLLDAGQIDEAMEQLETAQDVSARKDVLLRAAPCYIESGRSHTVATWISRLPRAAVDADGWLLYWDALCCLGPSPARAHAQLEKAYERFSREAHTEGRYRACSLAMRAIVQEGNDFQRLDMWAERIESMQAHQSACPEPLLGLAAAGMLSAFSFRRIDPARKTFWAEHVMALATNAGDLSTRFMIGGALAMYFVFHDDPAQVAVIAEMLRAAARGPDSSALAALSQMEVTGLLTWIGGDNRGALALVRNALALAARTGVFFWNDHLSHLGATAALAAEDVDAAQEFLGMLAESAQRGGAFASGGYQFYASWEALLRGDNARALHFMRLAIGTGDALDYAFAQSLNAFGSAQIASQMGRLQEAKESLALARERAGYADSPLVLHACDLLASDLLWDEDREQALGCLKRGLALARERGYFNGFWLRRSWMARVVVRALDLRIETKHVRDYVTKHRLAPEHVPQRVEAWPWPHRLRAFGAFEHAREEDRAPLPTADAETRNTNLRGMPLRLLQAIVAFGARGVRESELIDALWPDAEGDGGRRVFDTTLHRLRRQLGDDHVVRVSDGRIFIDGRLCWVDVWAFEDLIAEAEREVCARARPAILEDLARRLLRLYRGPLLGEEGAASWALGPRERLARKFVRAAEPLGRALEAGARLTDAAALYRRALDEQPLAESLCAGAMRCDAAAGRAANAVQTFEEYRARLAEIRSTEPGSEITSLYAQLKRPSSRERARPS